MNLIFGKGSNDLEAINIYLNKLNIKVPYSNYLNKIIKPTLKKEDTFSYERQWVPEKEIQKDIIKGEDLNLISNSTSNSDPISLFERLTLLISSVKVGHNNLNKEIKFVFKELLDQELITKEKYNVYKNKYFS